MLQEIRALLGCQAVGHRAMIERSKVESSQLAFAA
jgi:hypothetical protein